MKSSSIERSICLITGATSGIGRAAAIALSKQGLSLIIIGRDKARCQKIANKAKQYSHPNAIIDFHVGDLSDLKEVKRITTDIKKLHPRIDVLINNVGARFMNYSTSRDGYEMTYALNHLSGFFLSHQLLDLLRQSEQGRIINLSSGSHSKTLDLDWILNPTPYDGRKAYSQSKLCNLLFTLELSKRLADTCITVNAVDPGGTATQFNRNNGFYFWIRHIVAHILSRNLALPQKGAETPVLLAHEKKLRVTTGKLFHKGQIITSFPNKYSEHDAETLWSISEKQVKEVQS